MKTKEQYRSELLKHINYLKTNKQIKKEMEYGGRLIGGKKKGGTRSGWSEFLHDNKGRYDGLPPAERMGKLGQEWRDLSNEQKHQYAVQAVQTDRMTGRPVGHPDMYGGTPSLWSQARSDYEHDYFQTHEKKHGKKPYKQTYRDMYDLYAKQVRSGFPKEGSYLYKALKQATKRINDEYEGEGKRPLTMQQVYDRALKAVDKHLKKYGSLPEGGFLPLLGALAPVIAPVVSGIAHKLFGSGSGGTLVEGYPPEYL